MESYIKDPSARLDYKVDWSAWLDDDTITVSTWEITQVGDGELEIDSSVNSATVATVWLTGGTDGRTYRVTNHVTTAGGRQDDRTIVVTCQDR